jgi:1-deoxy-D-xylulose-5-phosphate synthase
VAKYFSNIRLSQTYEDLRKTTKNILEHTPIIGKSMEDAIERIKKHLRMVLPASQLFESLNIPYFGPVDGHDTGSLVQLFTKLSHLDHPAILHVYTKKGKGFTPASDAPGKFHSTGPFVVNGDSVESEPPGAGKSFTQAFGESIVELGEKDKRIIAITSAMTDGTGLAEFRKRFGGRFYDVGIAESAAVDIAAGLASCGLKPLVCIYSTFLQRSFDQIFQEVALQNLPVIFCIDRAGVVGSDGPTHHGLMDTGFIRMMPNMVLVSPSDEVEMKLTLEFAIDHAGPVVIRYPKDLVPEDDHDRSGCLEPFRLGKSVVVRRAEDSSVAIVAYGSMLTEALDAAALLAGEGIEVAVINGRFASPVDEEIISLLSQGKDIITVEDHRVVCGFGSAVLEQAAARGSYESISRIVTMGMPREFIRHDCRKRQLMESGVSADKIAETAMELFKSRVSRKG